MKNLRYWSMVVSVPLTPKMQILTLLLGSYRALLLVFHQHSSERYR